ncbi:isopenicillin N synthase family dioxygenase [Actinokineospora diospyrosa]|uniref:Isopenicillin N synthase n=1 Tax=Actinokineospora diospyrosa TaxID=103728 RepID=A0ABT1I881_9PSEU|nr:2-oxoglutarate and iron-dependent oxygenase domain-containing protein [Actinokineospora diospyrosa]MCP2268839.1 Isopenicillin N synthase [Actinokineospora diospyrosa]
MIPTVSLTALTAGDPRAVDAIHTATRDVGLFYVDGSPEFAKDLFDISRRFFALPMADKQAISITRSPNYRGYVGMGEESTNGAADLKESFEFGMESLPPSVAHPPPYYQMYGGNQWPSELALPGFRSAIEAYSAYQEQIGAAVVVALAGTLGLSGVLGQSDSAFGEALCSFARVIYYGNPGAYGDDARLAAHTDSGMVTVSVQDCPGLEVLAGGEWVSVAPPDGCCVVFTGELLELWSSGYYRACVHRVHNRALRGDRVSLITFFIPELRSVLRPVGGSGAEFVVGEREWARVGQIF